MNIIDFLEIQDYLCLVKLNRKIKNCTIRNHKLFICYYNFVTKIRNKNENSNLETHFKDLFLPNFTIKEYPYPNWN